MALTQAGNIRQTGNGINQTSLAAPKAQPNARPNPTQRRPVTIPDNHMGVPVSGFDSRCGYYALATALFQLPKVKIIPVLEKVIRNLKLKDDHQLVIFKNDFDKSPEVLISEDVLIDSQRIIGDQLFEYYKKNTGIRDGLISRIEEQNLSQAEKNEMIQILCEDTFISADVLQALAQNLGVSVCINQMSDNPGDNPVIIYNEHGLHYETSIPKDRLIIAKDSVVHLAREICKVHLAREICKDDLPEYGDDEFNSIENIKYKSINDAVDFLKAVGLSKEKTVEVDSFYKLNTLIKSRNTVETVVIELRVNQMMVLKVDDSTGKWNAYDYELQSDGFQEVKKVEISGDNLTKYHDIYSKMNSNCRKWLVHNKEALATPLAEVIVLPLQKKLDYFSQSYGLLKDIVSLRNQHGLPFAEAIELSEDFIRYTYEAISSNALTFDELKTNVRQLSDSLEDKISKQLMIQLLALVSGHVGFELDELKQMLNQLKTNEGLNWQNVKSSKSGQIYPSKDVRKAVQDLVFSNHYFGGILQKKGGSDIPYSVWELAKGRDFRDIIYSIPLDSAVLTILGRLERFKMVNSRELMIEAFRKIGPLDTIRSGLNNSFKSLEGTYLNSNCSSVIQSGLTVVSIPISLWYFGRYSLPHIDASVRSIMKPIESTQPVLFKEQSSAARQWIQAVLKVGSVGLVFAAMSSSNIIHLLVNSYTNYGNDVCYDLKPVTDKYLLLLTYPGYDDILPLCKMYDVDGNLTTEFLELSKRYSTTFANVLGYTFYLLPIMSFLLTSLYRQNMASDIDLPPNQLEDSIATVLTKTGLTPQKAMQATQLAKNIFNGVMGHMLPYLLLDTVTSMLDELYLNEFDGDAYLPIDAFFNTKHNMTTYMLALYMSGFLSLVCSKNITQLTQFSIMLGMLFLNFYNKS